MRGLLVGAALLALAGCGGPVGPIPGGRLSGEVVSGPVSDWSFTAGVRTAQLETHPDHPHSVNCWVWSRGTRLYVPTSMIAGTRDPGSRQWVRNVLADPRVRIRLDGRIFSRRAVRVEDPAELAAARSGLIAKYQLEPVTTGRERHAWIFRLDPPDAAPPTAAAATP